MPSTYRETAEPDLSPLGVEEYEAQLNGLAFFEANPDTRCIWEFYPEKGELPGLSLEAGVNSVRGSDYWIVCPFVPGRLIVHSPVALRAGTFQLQISHAVLFDSNLYDRIVRFVESPERMSPDDLSGTGTLLKAIVVRRYDYQMMPYLIESYAASSADCGYEYAHRVMAAMLHLHMMDKEHFVATGSIRRDPAALGEYEARFGTADLDRIIEAQLEGYQTHRETPVTVKLTLIALLEMVLIRRRLMPNRTFDAQFEAFDDFSFARLGMFAGAIRNVALFYFAGKLDRWIRTQRNSDARRALGDLTNSAWDLFLGALPQQILAGSSENQPVLAHFCTRERELAMLLSVSLLWMLNVSKNGSFCPYLTTETNLLHQAIGEGSRKSLGLADRRAVRFFEDRASGRIKRIDPTEIDVLLEDITGDFLSKIGSKA